MYFDIFAHFVVKTATMLLNAQAPKSQNHLAYLAEILHVVMSQEFQNPSQIASKSERGERGPSSHLTQKDTAALHHGPE